MTIRQQLETAFPFDVVTRPLSGPNGEKTPYSSLFRTDNNECVGDAVSKQYRPHTRDQVIELCEAATAAFDTESQVDAFWRDGTHYVTVQPSAEFRFNVAETDTVWPRLIVDASYRSRAFRVSLGVYRDRCKNLAMMHGVEQVQVSFRHFSTLSSHVDLLIQRCRNVVDRWGSMTEMMQAMNSVQVQVDEYLASVLPVPKENSDRSQKYHYERVAAIVNRLNREVTAAGTNIRGGKVSGWLAYNAVQGYMQHDQRRYGERMVSLARASMTWDSPIVRKAEELALAG